MMSMQSHKSMQPYAQQASGLLYRPDIDGLRAVAVLSVLFFHAFPTVLPGGFVGVDVFFVISGYLITSIIISKIDKDSFSITHFYVRRILRLFPALCTVLLSCLIFGWYTLLADEYESIGKHVIGGGAFFANIMFWRESNYFDSGANTKILLHLWSLGVEEQFYLVWPALLLLARKMRINYIFWCVLILIFSFAYSAKIAVTNPVAAFYSPVSRFWELLFGVFLALPVTRNFFSQVRIPDVFNNAASVVGLALLATGIGIISATKSFPGFWALLPVGGTFLLVATGPRAWVNRTLLSRRELVWIGLISYPLYLWHWPLLTYARILENHIPIVPVRLCLLALSFLLAWMTYRFVETPIRTSRFDVRAACVLAVSMFGIVLFGVYDYHSGGLPSRSEKTAFGNYFKQAFWNELPEIGQNQCNFYQWQADPPTFAPRANIDQMCYTKHSTKSVLLIGDSTVADMYYGIVKTIPADISVMLIYSSGCQVRPISRTALQTNACEYANDYEINYIKENAPDIVLMSSNNSFDNIEYIRSLSRLMKSYGVKHVLVMSQRPHWIIPLYKVVINDYWDNTPRYIPGHQDKEILALGESFESQMTDHEPFEYINLHEFFCNSEGCLAYLGDDRKSGLISNDTVHLRPFASICLAKNKLVPLIMDRLQQDAAQ